LASTIIYPDLSERIVTYFGVYAPQHDSRLLAGALTQTGLVARRRVLDLCTGTGVIAIAAALQGAASVTALDICARANTRAVGVEVHVRVGSLARALASGPYDIVVCNPPYVPVGSQAAAELIPSSAGPARAWNGGRDGRSMLDPLCASAPRPLARGGTLLVVQSALSGVGKSMTALRSAGLDAEIIACQWVPLGPVLMARARWLDSGGLIPGGCREEQLVVIRADKP
jgi:release factor glutamine methyltransferase